ncbi:MAG: RHS repeat-associated core domain-containing protein, partial [Candidatus Eisenbacteria bacterium]|nr:RHS repeat-associated core domain-containing protein [Candidatus Eisenbacteria bacterium]
DVDLDENTTEYRKYHLARNMLGSIVNATDASGEVVESYEYDVYGQVTFRDAEGEEIACSAIMNSELFAAGQYDQETGLFWHRRRTYDPATGVFLQRDPWGFVLSSSLYTYAISSPVLYADPVGLSPSTPGPMSENPLDHWRAKTIWGRHRGTLAISVSWGDPSLSLKPRVCAAVTPTGATGDYDECVAAKGMLRRSGPPRTRPLAVTALLGFAGSDGAPEGYLWCATIDAFVTWSVSTSGMPRFGFSFLPMLDPLDPVTGARSERDVRRDKINKRMREHEAEHGRRLDELVDRLNRTANHFEGVGYGVTKTDAVDAARSHAQRNIDSRYDRAWHEDAERQEDWDVDEWGWVWDYTTEDERDAYWQDHYAGMGLSDPRDRERFIRDRSQDAVRQKSRNP